MKISLGTLDETWQQYNLFQAPLIFNDSQTDYKAIVRQDKIVSIVKEGYELLPNEEAVKIADSAAEMAGLVPFDEFRGEWYTRMGDHKIYDKNETRVHALYASNSSYEVNGDKMHLGVGVHNSIDGTMGFGCGVFTFRHACANMVFAGMRGYEQSFDQRKTLDYIYKRHTVSLSEFKPTLKNVILGVMEKAIGILESYRIMTTEKATDELIEKIKKSRISNKVLPDYLTAKAPTVEVTDLTQWKVYNDVTEAIWHNAKSAMKTKLFQFQTLHQIMPLEAKQI